MWKRGRVPALDARSAYRFRSFWPGCPPAPQTASSRLSNAENENREIRSSFLGAPVPRMLGEWGPRKGRQCRHCITTRFLSHFSQRARIPQDARPRSAGRGFWPAPPSRAARGVGSCLPPSDHRGDGQDHGGRGSEMRPRRSRTRQDRRPARAAARPGPARAGLQRPYRGPDRVATGIVDASCRVGGKPRTAVVSSRGAGVVASHHMPQGPFRPHQRQASSVKAPGCDTGHA